MAEALPEYRVKARNTSAGGENPIHDDETARRHGFPGALVPGVTVYAYLTHPLVEAFGLAWLERGTVAVRFVKPVMDGEEVLAAGHVTAREAQGVKADLTVSTALTGACAVATASLAAGSPTPVNLSLYPAAPLPTERPPVSREHLRGLDHLGTPVIACGAAEATEYLERIGESSPAYRGPGGAVHPAFYLHLANRALSLNVRLGPWIHVSSTVRHLGLARIGETLAARGRVRSLFEKKSREYVELDLVIVAGDRARPVAQILHTAIYRIPSPSAG
jgi:acyl dehydratase